MKKILCIFLEIIIIIFSLCGCGIDQENNRNIEEKIDSEIEYIEDTIFAIANKHVKKEYIENKEINWDSIKSDVQKINNSWITLELDCAQIKINDEKIVNCSNNINNLLFAICDESENSLLEYLYKIDENLNDIKNEYTEDKNSVKKSQIKESALKIYYFAYQQKFDVAITEVEELSNFYSGLINDESYRKENNYNLNKIALLIEEYSISIQSQEIDLVKMKYLNLIERI